MQSPVPLDRGHDATGFDSGDLALDDWLRDHALQSGQAQFSKSYVILDGDRVLGYYTLAAGCVAPADAPGRVRQGGGQHEVPVAILARLAVDRSVQDQGYGAGLVRDALYRVAMAADIIGIRAVLVHMKRPELRDYYEKFDFEMSPVSDTQMFLLMKDLRKALGL